MKKYILCGCTYLLTGLLLWSPALHAQQNAHMSGRYFQVEFDEHKGLFSVRHNNKLLVNNARLEIQTEVGLIKSSEQGMAFASVIAEFSDALGSGRMMQIQMKKSGLDISTQYKIYESKDLMTINVNLVNVSAQNIPLQEIRPLVVDGRETDGLQFPDIIENTRVLTQGYSFIDSGELLFLRDERFKYSSNWNVAFYDPKEPLGMAIGALNFDQTETQLFVGYDPDSSAGSPSPGLSFKIACSTNKPGRNMLRYKKTEKHSVWIASGRGMDVDYWLPDERTEAYNKYLLKSGSKISTGPVGIIFNEDPLKTLELWAEYARVLNDIRLPRALPVGWCSWPDMYYNINETKILRLADFAVRERLPDFGFDIIQIDDGFQRKYGDWDGNLYFPRGMKWLSEELRKRGLTPGIWIAPYAISINSDIALNHQNWLYRDQDGTIRTYRYYIGIPVYGLDISIPGAQNWMRNLFSTISSDWGYDFFKLDYILNTVVDTYQFNNPFLTKAEVYRNGLGIVREGVGEDAYVLECGILSAAGRCDSWRVNRDIGARWNTLTMTNGTAQAVHRRYYMHGNLFNIDPDHLVVRDPLTIDQARVLATNVAISGGQVLTGDELYRLPEERLRIIKNVMPPYGKAARSVDLFETNFPAVSSLRVERNFEDWWIISVVNWTENPLEKTIDLKRVGLNENTMYLAYEFWDQEFLGLVKNSLNLNIRPTSVKVIALRKKLERPQIIGTDRHILQGAVELSDVRWDAQNKQISGKLNGARDHSFNITFYQPDRFEVIKATVKGKEITPTKISKELIRLPVDFGDNKVCEFSLKFN